MNAIARISIGSRLPLLRYGLVSAGAVALFFVVLRFGAPAHTGLDASWTEVMAWAYLNGVRFGTDLAFTYGPLGFLHPAASYFPGIFEPFVAGQILMTGAFSVIAVGLLHQRRSWTAALFVVAIACSCSAIPGDVQWVMTLLFGALLVSLEGSLAAERGSLALFAVVAGAIALTKFSLLPIWVLCVLAVVTWRFLRRGAPEAFVAAFACIGALLLAWTACGQRLGDLASFLVNGFAIALGYGKAMGIGAPILVELAGAACTAAFGLLCAASAWNRRRDPASLVAIALCALSSFVLWRSHFTRADHAPWFWTTLSLLPFALLCHQRAVTPRFLRVGFSLLVVACAAASLSSFGGLVAHWSYLTTAPRDNFRQLGQLPQLKQQRDDEWREMQRRAAYPNIAAVVGADSVDLFATDQTIAFLNGFHYAPRPIFQGYSAYTPYLDRLNEAYMLRDDAPEYVVLRVSPIDGRVPMIEDPLAHLVVLERYRPVLLENGHLLLRRDAEAHPEPLIPPSDLLRTRLGETIKVDAPASMAVVARIRVRLSLLGHIYSLLLREPTLRIAVGTDAGEYAYRFVRENGEAGFVLSPLIRDTFDWARAQLASRLPVVSSVRVEPEVPWQSVFFDAEVEEGFAQVPYLRAPASQSPGVAASLLNELMQVPTFGVNAHRIVESGKEATFVHSPGLLRFQPEPGIYHVESLFGIVSSAFSAPACADADGVGVSMVRVSADGEQTLLHVDYDPFHGASRTEQRLALEGVAVQSGEVLEYRVDPGHGGSNTACDWSFVRDFKFTRGEAGANQN